MIRPPVTRCNLVLCGILTEEKAAEFFRELGHLRWLKISTAPRGSRTSVPDFCLSLAFTNLGTLNLSPLAQARSLYELRSLPRLHTLHLTNLQASGFIFPSADPDSLSFSALRSLIVKDFDQYEPTFPGAFLRAIKGPLQEVELGAGAYEIPGDFYDVLNALQLHEELLWLSLYGRELDDSEDVPRIDASSLSPLCRCAMLKQLCLFNINMQIDIKDFARLGAAWPDMETLKLAPPSTCDELYDCPSLSIVHLRQLAMHFPCLGSLCIPFNTPSDAFYAYMWLPPVQSTTVYELEIPRCPIRDSPEVLAEVAALIVDMFPEASVSPHWMYYCLKDEEEDDESEDEWDKLWWTVSKLMNRFTVMKERAITADRTANNRSSSAS